MSNQKQPGPPRMMGGSGPMAAMGRAVEKPKNFKATLKRLLGYLKPHRMKLVLVVFLAFASTGFTIASPKIIGSVLDLVKNALGARTTSGSSLDWVAIGTILLWLVALYFLSALFTFITQWVMSGVAQNTVRDLREAVSKKLGTLPLKYFDEHPHGDILSRMTNDVDTISNTLQQSITQALTSAVQLAGFIVMMFTISWLLTLIVLVTMPLYILVTGLVAKKSQKFFAAQQKELGGISAHVEEMFTGHSIVKAYGQEAYSLKTFHSINTRLAKAGWKAQFVSGMLFPAMGFVGNVGYVLISVVGGLWITAGKLTLGDMMAFIQYSRQFTMPITQTAQIANIIQSTVACAERVFEILDQDEEIPNPPPFLQKDHLKGKVEIENLSFRYKEEVPLLENLNITAQPGHTIAIVGPTGAGKTTLVNLLMRFYELRSGKVSIDGVDTQLLSRNQQRKIFGMVLQDTWLFGGTIKENIAYGRAGATEEEIKAAAVAACADHFIHTLPEGYDTILNEEASNISQGQKQLLTIARALLADPTILILDEATSNVDTRTEVLIQKAMATLMKGRTNFVIAHRLSTIRNAELILVMNHGQIVEQGTHEELLAKKGFYAELYEAQFQGEVT